MLTRRFMILAQTLQVILNTGEGVCQTIELTPGWWRVVLQQMLLDVFVANREQAGCSRQRNHRQCPAYLHQQRGQRLEPMPIPRAVDIIDDHVLGLLQPDTRLLDHQLMDLGQVCRWQAAVFTVRLLHGADHPGQGRFDVQECASDIHQRRVIGFTLALGQTLNNRQLIDDDFTWLTEAKDGQGIRDLLQRRQQAVEFTNVLAVAAHEDVQAIFDPDQLLA